MTFDTYKLYVHHMDVKTAFLNGDLKEKDYMEQLGILYFLEMRKKIYKLVKSLQGLK